MPEMQDTQVWFMAREDPLEEEMATHPRILTWKVSWTEEPGGLQSGGCQRVGHDWAIERACTQEEEIQPWLWTNQYQALPLDACKQKTKLVSKYSIIFVLIDLQI